MKVGNQDKTPLPQKSSSSADPRLTKRIPLTSAIAKQSLSKNVKTKAKLRSEDITSPPESQDFSSLLRKLTKQPRVSTPLSGRATAVRHV